MRLKRFSVAAVVAILSVPQLAVADGGSGAIATTPEAVSCIQKGADGKPVQKLSSEEVCPMYQFTREDCARDGRLGLANDLVEDHCSTGARGLSGPDDLSTGSVTPPR